MKSDYDNHRFAFEEVKDCSGTDIFEFGVYSGQSLYSILNKCKEANIKPRRVFGFDSFCGLRLEESDKVVHEQWVDGSFDARRLFKINSPEHISVELTKYFKSKGFDVRLIVGEFNKLSKTTIDIHDIGQAFYINIDCDLYSSAKQALNFIFDNNLLAINGLIRYDDYHAVKGGGEELAHRELAEERGVRFDYLESCIFKYRGRQ
jgi:hypothetical protein